MNKQENTLILVGLRLSPKFRADISSNGKVFHTIDTDRSVCMAAICYSRPILAEKNVYKISD